MRQRAAIYWLGKSREPNGGNLAGVTILEADCTTVAAPTEKNDDNDTKHDDDCDDDH